MSKLPVAISVLALAVACLAWWERPQDSGGDHTVRYGGPIVDAMVDDMAAVRSTQRRILERLRALEGVGATAPVLPPEQEIEEMEDAADAAAPVQETPVTRAAPVERIVQAGLTPGEYDAMEARAQALYFENFQREWLARRERYLASEPLPSARQQLREELGDDSYDRYLYASGQPNRVRVGGIMPGSAADRAGIREGDLLLSYDDQRLFGFRDLQRASFSGEPGETVLVEVRRSDGTVAQLVMPRGPLGISGTGGGREAPGT